jgi:hypothetical protein
MNTLNLIIARFPLGMAAVCGALVILLFILLIVRTFESTGHDIDTDQNNE